MTRDQKIVILGRMLEDEPEDEDILGIYLDMAGEKILNRIYPFKTSFDGMDVPDKYASTQLKIAHYMLNKRGAEGQIQHIENGIHRNYGSADVPDGMLAEIVPYCQAIR